MNIVIRLKNFIEELEEKTLYQYFAGVVGIVIILSALFMFMGYRKQSNLKREIISMNRMRGEARDLLSKHATLSQRKGEVDDILAQDPTFKIKEYFLQIVEELNLTSNSSKDSELSSPQDLKNGYSETKLDSSFSGITMQQLCDLMFRLEKNRRVFIKEISISKNFSRPTLEVTLVIATLQPTVGV